jgi:uncharacterized protein (TIGR02145 family)
MAETVELATKTEVTVQGTVLDIFTYYDVSFTEFLQFFIIEILGMVGTIPFAEGELGYTAEGEPDFSANVNDQGELVISDDNIDPYSIDNDGYLIYGNVLTPPVGEDAIAISDAGFTANWDAVTGATGYYLDVSTDSQFDTYVTGYQNLDVNIRLSEVITGLSAGINYYYRVRAYDNVQTSLDSNIVTAVTSGSSVTTITDKDGNVYNTITIGVLQIITENLKVTHYADGTSIPNLTADADWIADSVGAMCLYNNDIFNKSVYGCLYNWPVIINAHGFVYFERSGVLEAEWRVPTDADWNAIITTAGGSSIAGGKLKEIGSSHWIGNVGGTDDYGFKGLPAGYRQGDYGTFIGLGSELNIKSGSATGKSLGISGGTSALLEFAENYQHFGFSVRCVRDV